jgi:hypothetical protein
MNGVILSNAQLQQMTNTAVALGTLTGSVTLNFALGSYQTVTTNGPVSIGFSNLPVAGVAGSITLQVTVVSTAHTITFPTAVSVNTRGIQGLNTSTNVLTVAAAGVYAFTFSTSDGGSTVNIVEVNKELQPFNNSSELLNDAGGANLALTTSYFTTVTASAASMGPGVNGQIKTLAMYSASGTMVITVANAGWKTSGAGTATFSATGQACTLQYINGKWFCIGNNGAVFG